MHSIKMNYKFHSLIITIVISMAFSSLALPPMVRFGEIALRIDDILLILAIAILPFYVLKIKINALAKTFIIFCIFAFFSILWGYVNLAVPSSTRDINEYLRILKSFLFILLSSTADLEKLKKNTYRLIFVTSWIIIIIALIEYVNPIGIGEIITKAFTLSERHTRSAYDSSRRIVITGGDPNTGGAIILYILLAEIAFLRHRIDFLSIIRISFLVIFLLISGSRTNFLIFISVVVFILFTEKNIKPGIKILGICFISCIVFLMWSNISYITLGLALFLSGENTSWIERIRRQSEAIQYFLQSPIFGWGPAKAIHSTTVDGEYALLLSRYGIFGIFSVLVFILMDKLKYFHALTSNKYSESQPWLKLSIYLTIMAIILMITNNLFSGYQLFLFFALIQVISIRTYKAERMKDKLKRIEKIRG